MRDLKELLEPLSKQEMPDRWSEIGRRTPRPSPPTRRGSRVGAAIVALAVVAATGVFAWRTFSPTDPLGPGGRDAWPAASNGAIAFERDGEGKVSGGSHIWMVMPDGSGERQLTFGDGVHDRWPAWSPDGTQVVFTRLSDESGSGLWITGLSGVNPAMVTPPGIGAARADWSPDGDHLVFAGVMGETPESGIYVINSDGTALTQVTGPEFFAPDNPEWSPDGSRIAFAGNLDDSIIHSWDVYVMNPDGSGLRNVTETPDQERSEWLIGWLPNGNLLVWQGPDEISSGPSFPVQTARWLEITDMGQVVRVVYEGPANTSEQRQEPSISPDGRFVLFDTPDERGNTIRFFDLSTGAVTPVTANGHTPAWQPVAA
jgi:Tol biopolymer transport system component